MTTQETLQAVRSEKENLLKLIEKQQPIAKQQRVAPQAEANEQCVQEQSVEEQPTVEEQVQVDPTSTLPQMNNPKNKTLPLKKKKKREVQHKCKVYMEDMSVS